MSVNVDLPNDRSEVSKTYMGIAKEAGTAAERELAVLCVAFTKFGGLNNFKVKYQPISPKGYDQTIHDYRNRKEPTEKRSASWRAILEAYGGYLKAVDENDFTNRSNLHFLKMAKETLSAAGDLQLVQKIDVLITDYQMEGY